MKVSIIAVGCLDCGEIIGDEKVGERADVRGFLNLHKFACPKCGVVGGFDQWEYSETDGDYGEWIESVRGEFAAMARTIKAEAAVKA